MQAALANGKKSSEGERATPTTRQHNPAYLVSADDLWVWERGEMSTLARRLLCEEELADGEIYTRLTLFSDG